MSSLLNQSNNNSNNSQWKIAKPIYTPWRSLYLVVVKSSGGVPVCDLVSVGAGNDGKVKKYLPSLEPPLDVGSCTAPCLGFSAVLLNEWINGFFCFPEPAWSLTSFLLCLYLVLGMFYSCLLVGLNYYPKERSLRAPELNAVLPLLVFTTCMIFVISV